MDILKIATWNVRVLIANEIELLGLLRTNKINISVITETKKILKGAKDTENYIIIYSRVTT